MSLEYISLNNYIIIISIILGFMCLLISRYTGREMETCKTTSNKISLIICLLIAWVFNSFFIWLAIDLLLLEISRK